MSEALLHAVLIVTLGTGGPALVFGLPLWMAYRLGRRTQRRHRRRAVERTREQLTHIHERVAQRTATTQALTELELDDGPFLEIGVSDYDESCASERGPLARSPSPESLVWAMRAVANCGIPDPRQQSPALGVATLGVVSSILAEAGVGISHPSWDEAAAACQRAVTYAASHGDLVSLN